MAFRSSTWFLQSLHLHQHNITCKWCIQSNITELNWHGLIFNEMTNRQAQQTHWSLVAYVSTVTNAVRPLDSAYCNALLLGHWSVRQILNCVSSVQLRRSVCTFTYHNGFQSQDTSNAVILASCIKLHDMKILQDCFKFTHNQTLPTTGQPILIILKLF